MRRKAIVAILAAGTLVAGLAAAPAASAAGGAPKPPDARERSGPAPLVGADRADAVKGQYIVVFRKGVSASAAASSRSDARSQGARITHTYAHALNGYAARLSDQALARVRSDGNVAYVEADARVRALVTQTPATWGLDRIDQRDLPLNNSYTYNATGAGVKAYIIDTGIRTTHTNFGGRATSGYDAIDGGAADDCNGHGTHVAGTVGSTTWGVAKSVSLVAVRVLNCQGSGTNSQVIAGINWVTSDHPAGAPAVANMSLGGGASTALDNAVANSVADGVTYAVAAGNSSANACNYSPARVSSALTVGSTTNTDARSSFSNYGSCLDIFAPGSSITSTWSTSDTATNTISGTSMATPHVAGVAALYLQGSPTASPSTVGSAITGSATLNKVTNPGTGSPNRLLYSLLTASPPPPPPPTGCGLAESYTGSLSGTGDADIHPNGNYYQSTVSGTHRACLRGPATGADFDLALYRWNGSSWSRVAVSQGTTSNEDIAYNGTAGYYYWRVYSYSGSGSYTFGMTRP